MKHARTAQSGFSIIEMMIGVALGLVVLAALTSFFVSTSGNRYEIERTTRQIENGRFAIDSLRNEVRLAGFYAEMSYLGAEWRYPDPCASPAGGLGGLGIQPSPLFVPVPIFGMAADAVTPPCIPDRMPDTDALVVRRFSTEMIPVGSVDPRQVYVQMSRCKNDSTTTPWAIDYGANAANFTLRRTDCAGFSDLYQYKVTIFYVRTYSDTPGDNIPTLVRADLDGATPAGLRISPLVEGVRGMRLLYGFDSPQGAQGTIPGDGIPDAFHRCDNNDPCGAIWNQAVWVRVSLLAENLEDSPGYTDNRIYDLGSGFTVGPLNDHRKRHVYTATITLPNRIGPNEANLTIQ